MKTIILLLICYLIFKPLSLAQEKEYDSINIDSYDIQLYEFEEPFVVYVNGKKETNSYFYFVYLKGYFGPVEAIPLEIYIGDYKISEYFPHKDGLAFKIYNRDKLMQLKGKNFRFRTSIGRTGITNLTFDPDIENIKAIKKD